MQHYLTTLDLKRRPRTLPANYRSKMKFSLKTLNFHRCPICLSYMKKTYIVMECLHRFCGDCIQKCLRMGMKECPSCRVHIPSRRSLRPDRNYDTIMEGMYGDIEVLEAREAKEIEDFNRRNNMNNSYSQSQRVKKLQQTTQRKKSNNPKGTESSVPSSETAAAAHDINNNNNITSLSTIATTTAATADPTTTPSGTSDNPQKYVQMYNFKESTLIEFILRKDPREGLVPRLYRECLKVSQDITISHLKRFLGKKVAYSPWADFQITVNAGGRQVVLDDSIKLGEVRTEICDFYEGMMLVLQYFVQPFVLDTECNNNNNNGCGLGGEDDSSTNNLGNRAAVKDSSDSDDDKRLSFPQQMDLGETTPSGCDDYVDCSNGKL